MKWERGGGHAGRTFGDDVDDAKRLQLGEEDPVAAIGLVLSQTEGQLLVGAGSVETECGEMGGELCYPVLGPELGAEVRHLVPHPQHRTHRCGAYLDS